MNALDILQFVSYGIAITSIIQALEFIFISTKISKIWNWDALKKDLVFNSKTADFILELILDKSFLLLNIIKIFVSIYIFYDLSLYLLLILLIIHIITLIKWLGTFNGGSDYMYLLILWLLCFGMTSEYLAQIVIWLICLQVCYSYLRAGFYKIKNSSWRNGVAISAFVNSKNYSQVSFFNNTFILKAISYSIIIFELGFPFGLLNPNIAIVFCFFGFIFHLVNIYYFGLNRFFFVWVSSYPVVIYCSFNSQFLFERLLN